MKGDQKWPGGFETGRKSISTIRQDEELLYLVAIAFETAPNPLLLTNANGTVLLVNQAFCEVTGFSKEEIVGKNPRLLSSGRHHPHFYQRMWDKLTKEGEFQGEIWNRRKTGELFLEYISIRAVRGENGDIQYYTAAFSDITEQKKHQEKIKYYAYHDYLTGLPNRLLFQQKVEEQIRVAQKEHTFFALLFLDLNGFKHVNDTFGHDVGDQLIQAVAKRLQGHFQEGVTVSRMAGDEFNILLPNLSSKREAEKVADDLIRLLESPFIIDQTEIAVSGSTGISIYPDDGGDLKALLKRANFSMYQEKGKRK
ncbi:GGDEF domain-containing protein [Brevibacillus borstelensis]|jgi:diguanylate cyclase (GGDEF)-like protein/PAS domain S-box-containing protein|uniref:GGDEF domain-containing protein n=1 Tax=Brevibacillus borstelensis TaxID=45462 RepID=UPI001166809D|nr:GGDEF domain-containing protein [Brevibacillus borstelensis]MED1882961.1 diguanylate cyclase [Brevibacillus borstelensis]GED53110.1 hypothetical protein BBO01nite_23510 [Brevibacillus borstelensis]